MVMECGGFDVPSHASPGPIWWEYDPHFMRSGSVATPLRYGDLVQVVTLFIDENNLQSPINFDPGEKRAQKLICFTQCRISVRFASQIR